MPGDHGARGRGGAADRALLRGKLHDSPGRLGELLLLFFWCPGARVSGLFFLVFRGGGAGGGGGPGDFVFWGEVSFFLLFGLGGGEPLGVRGFPLLSFFCLGGTPVVAGRYNSRSKGTGRAAAKKMFPHVHVLCFGRAMLISD